MSIDSCVEPIIFKPPAEKQSKLYLLAVQRLKTEGIIKFATPEEVTACHNLVFDHFSTYENKATRTYKIYCLIDCLKRCNAPYELILQYSQAAMDCKREVQENYKQNGEISAGRIEIKKKWNYETLFSKFEELLYDFNNHKETPESHNLLLILALNLLQPPLRSEIADMIIAKQPVVCQDGKNYLFCLEGKKYFYYLTKYKNKIKNKSIDILNYKLKAIFDESYKRYPRLYVLETSPGIALGYNRFLLLLTRNIDPGFSVDCFRSIFITDCYKHKMSYAEKEILANKMCHSVAAQQIYYNKIN